MFHQLSKLHRFSASKGMIARKHRAEMIVDHRNEFEILLVRLCGANAHVRLAAEHPLIEHISDLIEHLDMNAGMAASKCSKDSRQTRRRDGRKAGDGHAPAPEFSLILELQHDRLELRHYPLGADQEMFARRGQPNA